MKVSFSVSQVENSPSAWLSSNGDVLYWLAKDNSIHAFSKLSLKTIQLPSTSSLPPDVKPIYGEVWIVFTP